MIEPKIKKIGYDLSELPHVELAPKGGYLTDAAAKHHAEQLFGKRK